MGNEQPVVRSDFKDFRELYMEQRKECREHYDDAIKDIWTAINEMRKSREARDWAMLLTLAGIIINLIVTILK